MGSQCRFSRKGLEWWWRGAKRTDFWCCVSSAKSWWFTEWLAMISERGVVYRTKRMGPSTEPWGTPYMSCDGDEDELLTEVDWYLSERYDWNHWSAVDWMPKTEFRRERRIWWSKKDPTKEEQNCCHWPERREYRLQYIYIYVLWRSQLRFSVALRPQRP